MASYDSENERWHHTTRPSSQTGNNAGFFSPVSAARLLMAVVGAKIKGRLRMSLLRDIQNSAIDPEVDVSTLLRKCKVLSVRLANQEFSNWVDQELSGYKDVSLLPDYRIRNVESKGHFSGPFGSGLRDALEDRYLWFIFGNLAGYYRILLKEKL